jgi:hypothetical protein
VVACSRTTAAGSSNRAESGGDFVVSLHEREAHTARNERLGPVFFDCLSSGLDHPFYELVGVVVDALDWSVHRPHAREPIGQPEFVCSGSTLRHRRRQDREPRESACDLCGRVKRRLRGTDDGNIDELSCRAQSGVIKAADRNGVVLVSDRSESF